MGHDGHVVCKLILLQCFQVWLVTRDRIKSRSMYMSVIRHAYSSWERVGQSCVWSDFKLKLGRY